MPPANLTARRLVAQDLLAKLEQVGWPSVDTADLSSATIRAEVIGPGREAWEAFAAFAPTAQIHHIRVMLEYNPSIFRNADG